MKIVNFFVPAIALVIVGCAATPPVKETFYPTGPVSGCTGPTWSTASPGGVEINQKLRVGGVKCFAGNMESAIQPAEIEEAAAE